MSTGPSLRAAPARPTLPPPPDPSLLPPHHHRPPTRSSRPIRPPLAHASAQCRRQHRKAEYETKGARARARWQAFWRGSDALLLCCLPSQGRDEEMMRKVEALEKEVAALKADAK
eukprot:COSAG04_NODE_576_length_12493_cov_23.368323_5_plen_115_part_00